MNSPFRYFNSSPEVIRLVGARIEMLKFGREDSSLTMKCKSALKIIDNSAKPVWSRDFVAI